MLLAPLRELAKKLEGSTSGRARIIFESPGVFRHFYLPGPVALRTVVGRHFHVLPFLDQLCIERQFYILGLNAEHLNLLHYNDGELKQVPLPEDLPNNAEVAGEFNAPDHTIRGESGAGPSSGTRTEVVFGISTEREKAHERLHEFFRLVDRGLSKAIGKQPLLLSGAGYEVAIYRREASYPFLMDGCLEGDLHNLPLSEIARRASEFARMQAGGHAQGQLRLLEEMSRTGRASFDIHHIVKAAEDGRVAKLILKLPEQAESVYQEMLVNTAAVLRIRSGAEIFVLPFGTMPHSSPVAAMFRY